MMSSKRGFCVASEYWPPLFDLTMPAVNHRASLCFASNFVCPYCPSR
jgi:hypothetical protein